ncbi:ribonuclease HIII [Chlamydia muridarum str. Nigg]|nr:ribonuclease HIII [Chlamydia muridarum]AHH22666.1 ribonuclease HIII [Chlamydia muridarum str. Nigg3 CMUT3-5]AHH23590.1 ribonuclease HIII [Chlamydia muridarum str. Nigg CM972]AID37812.1 ribonuclease HIII [Chlamydia muridarum str. Nigg 2 MCR]AIT91084.1 ribonuclease HIII [Chlamydia muridarum]AIT91979.1 ribonuclease HIII [Chlamydia muridarum]
MPTPFVSQLSPSLFTTLREQLEKKGFVISIPPHTVFQGRSSTVSCTVYQSGKIVVQGKGTQEFVEFFLEPEILHSFSIQNVQQDLRPRIGVDESGKGDFFGPLCTAGVYAPSIKSIESLYEITICDSKLISDAKIPSLARSIRSLCTCKVITLFPEKYNALYANFQNLNALLAWTHATIIDDLAPKPTGDVFAISDQFASSERVLLQAVRKKRADIELIQRHRAEQDVVVAAASILARDAFLSSMQTLESQYQVRLLKGASGKVKQQAKEILRDKGQPVLEKVCKTHFKTFYEVLGSTS